MINAKKELIEHIYDRKVEKIHIFFIGGRSERFIEVKGSAQQVLKMLDFDYDNGYGTQELYGAVWYNDGTWSEREEYDGSENWVYRNRPDPNSYNESEAGL